MALAVRPQKERFMPLAAIRDVLADGSARAAALIELEDRIIERAVARRDGERVFARRRAASAGAACGVTPCVYIMRMARVNVYLPDELAEHARRAGINVSALTQEALRHALRRDELAAWLDRVEQLPPTDISHDQVLDALDHARAELGEHDLG